MKSEFRKRGEEMGTGFENFRKKSVCAAYVKGALTGVCCALFVLGAIMLSVKLCAVRLAWFYYVLIGVAVAICAFFVTFFLTKPNDKKLAKRLDRDYSLREKVQTMVEFDGQDGEMLRLQRADADETLKNVRPKKNSVKRIWQYAVIVVLGCALFLTAVVVPSRYQDPNDDRYTFGEWDEAALVQLIADVEGFSLEDKVKPFAVASLTLLREELLNTTQNSVMRAKVQAAAKEIDNVVIAANTYRQIALALNSYSVLNDFKLAMVRASNSYKGNETIDSVSKVNALADDSESMIRAELTVFTQALNESIASLSLSSEIYDKLIGFLDAFNESMVADEIGESLSDDSLYRALAAFSEALGPIYEYRSREPESLKKVVSSACAEYLSGVSGVMVTQVYNRIVNEYICNRLSEIFKVSVFPEDLDLPGVSDEDSDSQQKPPQSGSIGDEQEIYGSNDIVYDPNTNEHASYGPLWQASYMAKLYELLEDPDANLSDEMRYYILQYISALNGDISNGSGSN